MSSYNVIVDATDNPGTRYLINDACVLAGKPLVSGAAIGMSGQLSVYNHGGGPCYRCMNPEPAPRSCFVSCSDGGVMGPVPGLIATQQVGDACGDRNGCCDHHLLACLLFCGRR